MEKDKAAKSKARMEHFTERWNSSTNRQTKRHSMPLKCTLETQFQKTHLELVAQFANWIPVIKGQQRNESTPLFADARLVRVKLTRNKPKY
jgi:hypothetical protein